MNEELHPTEKGGILRAKKASHLIKRAELLFVCLLFIWSEGTADPFRVLKGQD